MKFLILLLISGICFAAPVKKIPKAKVIKGILPLEFEMIYNYVRKKIPRKKRLDFLKLTHDINKNFQKVPKENLMFSIKAEVYRSLIQYEFDVYVQNIDINPIFINNLDRKVKTGKGLYDKLSIWLITALINDFEPYMNSEVFKNLNKINKNNATDMKLANEIKRKLRYLSKWFYIADKYDPERFNNIVYKMAWKVLTNLKSYMEIMGHFSGKLHLEQPVAYFELPPLPDSKNNPATMPNQLSKFEIPQDYSSISHFLVEAAKQEAQAKTIIKNMDATPPNPIQNGEYLGQVPYDPNFQNGGQGQVPYDPNFQNGDQGQVPYDPNFQNGGQGQVPYDPNFQNGGQEQVPYDPNFQNGGQEQVPYDPNQPAMGQNQYVPYDPYTDTIMNRPQGQMPAQNGGAQQGQQQTDQYGDAYPQGEMPWVPDEYGDQLQQVQESNYIETPDGKKYKDGVYVVPHGGKSATTDESEEDEEF
jgi:hypothetical protein